MDISHLYDDSFFGSVTTALDVKEKLQTQEINAREERNFEQWVKIFQRGKDMCKRNMACEKWQAHRALYSIWERTPRLEKSLATEKARVASLEKSILARSNSVKRNISTGIFQSHGNKASSQMDASIKACPPGHDPGDDSGDDPGTRVKSKQHDRLKERPLNTDSGCKDTCTSKQTLSGEVREWLNWRQQKRRHNEEKFRQELFRLSKPVIAKARVVLKGRSELDANQYLDELENYLLHLESDPTPRKQVYTLSEDEPQKVLHNDSLATRSNLSNNCSGGDSAVLPPVLSALTGDAAEDRIAATNGYARSSSHKNVKYTVHSSQLKIGGNTEDCVERHPESVTEPGKRTPQLTARTSVSRLQQVRNNTSTSRYSGRPHFLPPLKTSKVVTRERIASRQGINNNADFVNKQQESSNISHEYSNFIPKKEKSRNVIGKMKNIDNNIRTSLSGVNNVTYLIRPRIDEVNDRNKLSRSNNFSRQTCNDGRNKANLHGNKDGFYTSNNNISGIVNERSNTCNYSVSSCSDLRSNTSNFDTITTRTTRNDNCDDDSIFSCDKGSNTCNSRIPSVINRRSNIPNPNTGDKRSDISKDSLPCITDKRNNSRKNHSRIIRKDNLHDVVTNYQGGIASDSKTRTSCISSNNKVSNHTPSSVPCNTTINADNCPQIYDTTDNKDKQTSDDTTTTRNRRFMDADNRSNPVRIQKNLNAINRITNNTTNIHNDVFQVITTSSESNNEYSMFASHVSPNNTDENKNTKNATKCIKYDTTLSNNTTRKLLHSNIGRNNDDFKSTDITEGRNSNKVINTNTNNTYNNTTVGCEYDNCDSEATNRDTNSTQVKSVSSVNDVSSHNEGRKNDIDSAGSVCNTGVTSNREMAWNVNGQIFQSPDTEVIKNTDRGTIQNFDRETNKNANREIIKNTNREVIKNTNREVIKKTKRETTQNIDRETTHNTDRETTQNIDREATQNTNRETTHNHDREIILNSYRETIQNSNGEVIKNPNQKIIKNFNQEIIKKAHKKIIKNANKATFRFSSGLAARKSSNIFSPSGGVSQVIPEEDE